MPMDYHMGYYAGTLLKTHAKAGQHHSELKNRLLHEFIDKTIVSFRYRFLLCVAATGGH